MIPFPLPRDAASAATPNGDATPDGVSPSERAITIRSLFSFVRWFLGTRRLTKVTHNAQRQLRAWHRFFLDAGMQLLAPTAVVGAWIDG